MMGRPRKSMAVFTKLRHPSSSFSAAAVAKKFISLTGPCSTGTLKFFVLGATGGTLV